LEKLKYLGKCDGLCGFLVQSFKNSINLMLVKMTYELLLIKDWFGCCMKRKKDYAGFEQ